MKLKAIIVDDEFNALKLLKITLNKYCPQIEIVGSTQSPVEAIELIKKTEFDILFLDIQMPKLTGFQILKKIEIINFDIIFTTAYDQYAIEAFKINASNYLLKPINVEDLKSAVQKVIKQKQTEETVLLEMLNNIKVSNEFNEARISIPFNKGIEFLKAKDIIYCKSDNNYTHIYLSDGTSRFISKTLKIIENKLPKPMFYRPHNSYVVNLDYVTKFYKSDGGYLEMSNGDKIRIARNKKDDIINLL